MTEFPDRHEQIRLVHAAFIREVVMTCQNPIQNPTQRQAFEALLDGALAQGWDALVGALRRVAGGARGPDLFGRLDEEDQLILDAILRGLQDPATLPDPRRAQDPALAAPGLAHMIHAAATGNPQALILIGEMAAQMQRAGGPLGRLAGAIRPLINGERDAERLGKGMDAQGERLLRDILDELARLAAH